MKHVSLAMTQMAARRLLNFHPRDQKKVDKVEYGLNPWQVLYRLRYPKYIEVTIIQMSQIVARLLSNDSGH